MKLISVMIWVFLVYVALIENVRAYDYEYLPQIKDQTSSNLRTHLIRGNQHALPTYNFTLFKCQCNNNNALSGTACLDRLTQVLIYEPPEDKITVVDTDSFQNVKVEEPQCPEGQKLATLDSSRNSIDQFVLLPSGYLYWQQQEFHHYCIEHKLDDAGDAIYWEARVCLSPPLVPRCCPVGEVLTEDLSCISHVSQVLSPPIMVDGVPVQWPGELPGTEQDLDCPHNEEVLNLDLGSFDSYFKYSSGKVSLRWLPPSSQMKEQTNYFCVGIQKDNGYKVKACYEDREASHNQQCKNNICVRKCCSEEEVLSGTTCTGAVDNKEIWIPTYYDSDDFSSAQIPDGIKYVYGFPLCAYFFPLAPDFNEADNFLLLTDGHLYVPSFKDNKLYPSTDYCIENFRLNDNITSTQALVCFPETTVQPLCDVTMKYVYPVLLLVSCVFLGATLFVYVSVSDLRKKLNGRCLISLVSSLLALYISLSVASLAVGKLSHVFCRITASVIHFSSLAAFFWLNVMCFDIWRTINKMRVVSGSRGWIRRRFLLYSLYSWGCPLVITLTAVIVEELPESYTNVIRPNFGSDFCWFAFTENKPMWLYLYMFILALMVANTVYFTLVTIILCRSQNDPMLKNAREVNRERLWLCFKLFLVMGVTWLAEVLSWQTRGACYVWIVTDIINTLQGLSIFLVFVCKKSTFRLVQRRWSVKGKETTISKSTSVTSASSRSRDSAQIRKKVSDSVSMSRLDNTNQTESMGSPPEEQDNTDGLGASDHRNATHSNPVDRKPMGGVGGSYQTALQSPLPEETDTKNTQPEDFISDPDGGLYGKEYVPAGETIPMMPHDASHGEGPTTAPSTTSPLLDTNTIPSKPHESHF